MVKNFLFVCLFVFLFSFFFWNDQLWIDLFESALDKKKKKKFTFDFVAIFIENYFLEHNVCAF